MKNNILTLSLLLLTNISFGQTNAKKYSDLIKKADSLYETKEYKKSVLLYSEAFELNGEKSKTNDRYNGACSFALANDIDASFTQLLKITKDGAFSNYNHIVTDTDLIGLHNDKRWNTVLTNIQKANKKTEAKYNKPLVAELDSIFEEDQTLRQQLPEVEKQFGAKSPEIKNHWKLIQYKDSVNLIKVEKILGTYGWLGSDILSRQGNNTLFLVIQHANLNTQEKYLPMMREAVKKGKAQGGALALLEDRVAMRQGKRQIYGSQIGRNPETLEFFVFPLENPEKVDERRAEVELSPLQEYVNNWKILWDVEKYKQDLPALEARLLELKKKDLK